MIVEDEEKASLANLVIKPLVDVVEDDLLFAMKINVRNFIELATTEA